MCFNSLFIYILIIAIIVNLCNSCKYDNTSTSNNSNDDIIYDYKSNLVDQQYIVSFKHYFDKYVRSNYIKTNLLSNKFENFTIIDHNKLSDTYPSDFDVIEFDSSVDVDVLSLIKTLTSHPYIKSVTPQRKLTRVLKSVKSNIELKSVNIDDSANDNDDDDDLYKNDDVKDNSIGGNRHQNRQLNRAIPQQIVDKLDAPKMWKMGFTGSGVNVAVFDTGLENNHPHFKNVVERIDWTNEKNADDKIGHGTFVAGVIASNKDCRGLAPDANLYIFKVFTNNQVSYTSWFLDAFNHALRRNIDVLNLSIGGPDFMDVQFVNKVWELTSKNVIMVSAIGNDGPLYGTLNNPADQMDVIGVGGINFEDQIAAFSSRGMTTWEGELPGGYGRVKPDIVTYGSSVRSSHRNGGCRTLSGTSVASPVVAGAIALLLSAFKHRGHSLVNPASVKQALMHSAQRLPNANMFEQGQGKLDLLKAYETLNSYKPQITLIPNYIDLTECPYQWPYCTQPLYYSGMPIIVNLTIINGMGVTGKIVDKPQWQPYTLENGHFLKVSISYSPNLWPWSGYIALSMSVSEECQNWEGIVQGQIIVRVETITENGVKLTSEVKLPIKANIIATPPRKQRLLWDQYHNLRYPPGYFPRDNLRMKNDPLDWNADHVHTNFKDMYQYLRKAGYFIEVLGNNYNCFNATNYAALLIVDSEEEFHESEVKKIYDDVTLNGLSLIIFGDWYNTSVMKEAKSFDENTKSWWTPDTGGSNVPALNELLKPYDIAFSDKIFEGEIQIGEHATIYASGSSIQRFPRRNNSYILYRDLKDQASEFLKNPETTVPKVPILGLHQVGATNADTIPGRIVVYGDSNCIDSSHMQKDCFWLLLAMLEYTCQNIVPKVLTESTSEEFSNDDTIPLPKRMNDTNFSKYSKVLKYIQSLNHKIGDDQDDHMRDTCPKMVYENPFPINSTAPNENIYKGQRLLSINLNNDDSIQQGHRNRKIQNEFEHYDENGNKNKRPFYKFDDSRFPIFTFIAIILVLTFFAYKLHRFRSKPRIKRSLFLNNNKYTTHTTKRSLSRNTDTPRLKYSKAII